MTAPTGRRLALIELVLAAVAFGLSASLAKQATRTVDGGQVALARFAVGLLAVGGLWAAGRIALRPVRWSMLLLRGVLSGVAGLLFFVSVARLPLGTTTLLNCTSPVFAAVLAALLLGERPGLASGAALLVSGAGVALVLVAQGATLGGSAGWQLVALLSGVAAGAGVVATRAARRTDGPWEVFALFGAVGLLLSIPVAAATWRPVDAATAGWLLGVGLTSLAGQLLLTHALGAVEASVAVTIAQLTVLVAAGLGVALHDDPVTPLVFLGGGITLAGVVASARLAR